MGKISFFANEALRSLWKNYFMTVAAIVTVFLSLAVLGVVLVFAYNIRAVLSDVEHKVEITVFLKDTASAEDIASMQKEISGWSEVKSVQFVTKDEALKRLKEDFKDQQEVLEGLPGNPLPASFEVALKDPKTVETVAQRFANRPLVDEVQYGKKIADRLFKVTSVVRNILAVFIVLLGAVSILLISNTIRLSIFARRREVEIMKLVGATNWFIRWPFVIEGVAVGLMGGLGAFIVVMVGSGVIIGRIRDYLTFLMAPVNVVPPVQLALILLGVGILIGASGSGLGLRRFLNV